LQSDLVVAVDVLLEMVTALMLAVLSLDEQLSDASSVMKFYHQSEYRWLVYFLVKIDYALQNASRTTVMFENGHTICR
jgi:hypothetical protein